jgi:hypothetical protein
MRVFLFQILALAAIAFLVVALSGEFTRIMATGGPYLFSERFFDDLLARLSGPGRMRFIFQPTVAILIGIRDGVKDARRQRSPFLSAVLFHSSDRAELLRGALRSIRVVLSIAVILDMISQFLIFREVHVGAAFLLGPVLVAIPYSISRALANRVVRERLSSSPVTLPPESLP